MLRLNENFSNQVQGRKCAPPPCPEPRPRTRTQAHPGSGLTSSPQYASPCLASHSCTHTPNCVPATQTRNPTYPPCSTYLLCSTYLHALHTLHALHALHARYPTYPIPYTLCPEPYILLPYSLNFMPSLTYIHCILYAEPFAHPCSSPPLLASRRILIAVNIEILGTAPDIIGWPNSLEAEIAKGSLGNPQPAPAAAAQPANDAGGNYGGTSLSWRTSPSCGMSSCLSYLREKR